jgi:hypothetical protein
MIPDPEFFRSRLVWRFLRSGGEGARTKVFENLSPETQRRLRQAASIREGEFPAIASVLDDNNWVLITTERVIDRTVEASTTIDHVEIDAFEMEIFWRARALSPEERIDQEVLGRLKEEQTMIELRLHSGTRHLLTVEAGNPYFGIVNVILFIAHRSYSMRRRTGEC